MPNDIEVCNIMQVGVTYCLLLANRASSSVTVISQKLSVARVQHLYRRAADRCTTHVYVVCSESLQCAFCIVQCAVCSVQFAFRSVNRVLCRVQCVLAGCRVQCALHSVQCAVLISNTFVFTWRPAPRLLQSTGCCKIFPIFPLALLLSFFKSSVHMYIYG